MAGGSGLNRAGFLITLRRPLLSGQVSMTRFSLWSSMYQAA